MPDIYCKWCGSPICKFTVKVEMTCAWCKRFHPNDKTWQEYMENPPEAEPKKC